MLLASFAKLTGRVRTGTRIRRAVPTVSILPEILPASLDTKAKRRNLYFRCGWG